MQYFATYLIYVAVLVRAAGWSQDSAPLPALIWILLPIFGVILFSEPALTRRFSRYPRLYTLIQSGLVITMLYIAPHQDVLPMLFFPLSFQAVQFFGKRIGFAWIGVFSVAMLGMFWFGLEWESGLTMVLASSGANFLMGSFAHLMARTEQARLENQKLFGNLQAAYRQLKDSAAQTEALAAADERHHLVRELHDSLTQTLFSMNLAVQAAQLAVADSPTAAGEHLSHLQSLARSAAGEVQTLTGQLPIRQPAQEGLVMALRHLAEQRLAQDGLQVSVEITGQRSLPDTVQANLYRITQEALNNVIRHAGAREACVRLCLENPQATLEIMDAGVGFDLQGTSQARGYGLTGMAERAREIGWELEIQSHLGEGTRIRVKEGAA
jgi:signal transduction histidine kinase